MKLNGFSGISGGLFNRRAVGNAPRQHRYQNRVSSFRLENQIDLVRIDFLPLRIGPLCSIMLALPELASGLSQVGLVVLLLMSQACYANFWHSSI